MNFKKRSIHLVKMYKLYKKKTAILIEIYITPYYQSCSGIPISTLYYMDHNVARWSHIEAVFPYLDNSHKLFMVYSNIH